MEPVKSPKSPKTIIENPLLKSVPFFTTPSLVPEKADGIAFAQPVRKPLVQATPGPPPRASLSLNLDLSTYEKPSATREDFGASPSPMSTNQIIPGSRMKESDRSFPLVTAQSSEEFWVIAVGLGTGCTSSTAFEFLQSFGRILSTKENNNWIAVQYDSELAAARASTRQLVRLGDSLCGVLPASPQFLQELTAKTVSTENFLPGSDLQIEKRLKYPKLEEKKLLLGSRGANTYDDEECARPSSICDRFFSWYFGWNVKEHQS